MAAGGRLTFSETRKQPLRALPNGICAGSIVNRATDSKATRARVRHARIAARSCCGQGTPKACAKSNDRAGTILHEVLWSAMRPRIAFEFRDALATNDLINDAWQSDRSGLTH
jgi:hypothetical protein